VDGRTRSCQTAAMVCLSVSTWRQLAALHTVQHVVQLLTGDAPIHKLTIATDRDVFRHANRTSLDIPLALPYRHIEYTFGIKSQNR